MTSDETAIRKLMRDSAEAVRAKDSGRALAAYAPDVVRYDLAPPLATAGAAARDKAGLERWFATWDGPIGFEFSDLSVTVGGDIAFCHGFLHISGTKTDGERPSVWSRATTCLRSIDGAWRIVHEHVSVPFYMDGSYKAAVDLHP